MTVDIAGLRARYTAEERPPHLRPKPGDPDVLAALDEIERLQAEVERLRGETIDDTLAVVLASLEIRRNAAKAHLDETNDEAQYAFSRGQIRAYEEFIEFLPRLGERTRVAIQMTTEGADRG